MREIRNSYAIDDSRRPVFTPFEADIARYLHISDCNVIVKVFQPYWEFCPVCYGSRDEDGEIVHRDPKETVT